MTDLIVVDALIAALACAERDVEWALSTSLGGRRPKEKMVAYAKRRITHIQAEIDHHDAIQERLRKARHRR